MNEFKQEFVYEIKNYNEFINTIPVTGVGVDNIEHLFFLANLLRSRFEAEMQRNSTTEEYIEMIKISSSFINK